jgi:hypothetical protein
VFKSIPIFLLCDGIRSAKMRRERSLPLRTEVSTEKQAQMEKLFYYSKENFYYKSNFFDRGNFRAARA